MAGARSIGACSTRGLLKPAFYPSSKPNGLASTKAWRRRFERTPHVLRLLCISEAVPSLPRQGPEGRSIPAQLKIAKELGHAHCPPVNQVEGVHATSAYPDTHTEIDS